MKKRILSLLLLISMVISLVSVTTSCEILEKPDAPILTLEGDTVKWEAVEGAAGYEVGLNGVTFNVGKNTREHKLTDGDTILVRAYNSIGKSAWSNVIRYEKPGDYTPPTKLSTPVISIDENGVAAWETLGATVWEYRISGSALRETTTPSLTLDAGDTLQVRAKGDGVNYASSEWSEPKTYLDGGEHTHTDANDDGECDTCYSSVIVVLDFYNINDLHGKFCDTDSQPGVDELSTYLKDKKATEDNVILLSSGDMWQGSAESSLTYGAIITEWMNTLGFAAMALGNHEYDWGAKYIKDNADIASFPFLAINIYYNDTNTPVEYASPSVMVETSGIQIGIIGAMGDCYGSILEEHVTDIHFKTGAALTSLVMQESNRLRSLGADIIVYTLHDGTSGYDAILSDGYVDLVFEGHTHSAYVNKDSYGVYHLQGDGENEAISHAELKINSVTGTLKTSAAEVIYSSEYGNNSLEDDVDVENLELKYKNVIDKAYEKLGINSSYKQDYEVEDLVAMLYYEAGLERWGDEYDIKIGGGFLRTRTPYDLKSGQITYADLLSLLPFNNQLVLCSVPGSKLLDRFINSSSTDQYCYPKITESINRNATYYIVVDVYTSSFSPNGLTEIERYDTDTYARDLLADYIRDGNLDDNIDTENYEVTSIEELNSIGSSLKAGDETSEKYFARGKIVGMGANGEKYGNVYIEDENGHQLFVYGMYSQDGTRYDGIVSGKPVIGDEVVLYGSIKNYYDARTDQNIIEMVYATIIEVN